MRHGFAFQSGRGVRQGGKMKEDLLDGKAVLAPLVNGGR